MKTKALVLFIFIPALLFAQLSPSVDSIPMRDGKKLAADYYPASTGAAAPTILIQLPYNRLRFRLIGLPLFGFDSQRPYAVVIVDWRCFYGSTSACVAQPNRGQDGYDIVEWIVSQSWSNGKVGTWGPSALGKIQYQTAREHPPGLICAVPLVAGSQFEYQEYFPGGAARTEYVEQLDALGFGLSTILYANPVYNNVWSFSENQNYYPDEIEIPMLLIGGWYDHNTNLMIDLFDGLKTQSPVSVRSQHRLLMGPWAHGGFGFAQVGTGLQGELFYPEATGWSDSLALLFFDYYLRNQFNGWDNMPTVQYFQMGENEWLNASDFPPQGMLQDTLYFQADQSLKFNPPGEDVPPTQFAYDPHDPSPTHGGATLRQDLLQGPYDQSDIVESRNDILIFSTDVLQQDVKFIGKSFVQLHVMSDKLDTDFSIRLTDVYPDGKSMLLAEGIQRMRFRDGYTANDTSVMVPTTKYQIMIPLPHTANTFLAGHRIRVDVTSSNYPRFDLNLNNGGTLYTAGDTLVAVNYVFHKTTAPSALIFQTDKINSVEEMKSLAKVLVYPNPAEDVVHLLFQENNNQKISLTLFNIFGKEMLTKEAERSTTIDLLEFPSGIYFLQITQDAQRRLEKLVVNR